MILEKITRADERARFVRDRYHRVRRELADLTHAEKLRIIHAVCRDKETMNRVDQRASYCHIATIKVGSAPLNIVWGPEGVAVGSYDWRFGRKLQDGAMLWKDHRIL